MLALLVTSLTCREPRADGEAVATVEHSECPEVVRSEESAAVGLRNLVTQWHIAQKGGLRRHVSACLAAGLRKMHSCEGNIRWTV